MAFRFSVRKGKKDNNPGNEASEAKHGMSPTEMSGMMKRFTAGIEGMKDEPSPAPLLPGVKERKRRGKSL